MDGAIHRAAGPQLKEYNRALGGCKTGQAKISPGFNLKAKWIIHTVGPVWHGGEQGEPELLAGCYRNAFEQARLNDIRTIAFPAISTGVYGYPREAAAEIAVSVMQQYEAEMEQIIACCFSNDDVEMYLKILEA